MSARLALALAALLLGAAGCGSSDDRASRAQASSRVDRCTERLLARAQLTGPRAEAERYVESTYCAPFEEQGWIYEDGSLMIDAHRQLASSGSEVCVSGGTRTVPCSQERGRPALDCALLHHVPRREVEAYLEEAARSGAVRCDDGTPLGELGTD